LPVFFGLESMLSQTLKLVKKVEEIDADQAEGNNYHKAGDHLPEGLIKIASPHERIIRYLPNQCLILAKKPGDLGTGMVATAAVGGGKVVDVNCSVVVDGIVTVTGVD